MAAKQVQACVMDGTERRYEVIAGNDAEQEFVLYLNARPREELVRELCHLEAGTPVIFDRV